MANTPRKFERPEIRACFRNPSDPNWFDGSVKALREGIGEDRILLGCMGDFTGTEARYLDASRLGSDVVGCYHGVGENYNPLGNSSLAQMPVADIHPQNLYPYAASSMMPIWNLSVTRPFGTWRVVALFNFTDAPRTFDVSLESLGLDPLKWNAEAKMRNDGLLAVTISAPSSQDVKAVL